MTDRIPEGITVEHIAKAIRKIESGAPNKFAESTGYDVLFEGKRYAPKAVVGVAAGELLPEELGLEIILNWICWVFCRNAASFNN